MLPYQASPARRGTVVGVDALGRLLVAYNDWPGPPQPIQRPFVGGATTGLHSVPQIGHAGDQVAVHCEVAQHPLHAVSMADASATLIGSDLLPGESALYGPNGETLVRTKQSGPHVLFQNQSGTVTLTIDPTSGKLTLTHPAGGGFVDGTTTLTVP